VPLYYISRVYSDFKLVHVAMSTLTLEEHYKFGMCIGEAVRNSDEDVVLSQVEIWHTALPVTDPMATTACPGI